jgi:K+-transporting ATPase ATPase A chain
MTFRGWLEISFVLIAVVAAAWPFSRFIETVFAGKKTVLTPLENMFYRLASVDPIEEQNWLSYTLSMLVFSTFCFVALYLIQRCQAVLPFNPLSQPPVAPDLAFNTAISFITNANWQAYAGETTMSHFTQMAGLTTHNFLDSAVAVATAVALARAFVRRETEAIGNFWVDITRATLYLLLPLSVVVALVLIALGTPQTLQGAFEASTLEGAKQTISIGPVASQEAIKLLGNNGGGFFNANSAHPFENPSALSNMIENWSQLILPTALVLAFGRMVGEQRQGVTLLAVMTLIFLGSLVLSHRHDDAGTRLTPHGLLTLRQTAHAPALEPDQGLRPEKAFLRGSGHGLLWLGADEVATVRPPVLSYWREIGMRYMTALCAPPVRLEPRDDHACGPAADGQGGAHEAVAHPSFMIYRAEHSCEML